MMWLKGFMGTCQLRCSFEKIMVKTTIKIAYQLRASSGQSMSCVRRLRKVPQIKILTRFCGSPPCSRALSIFQLTSYLRINDSQV